MNRDALIEEVVSAWRQHGVDGEIRASVAWHDLDEAGRLEAHQQTVRMRQLEAAMDPDGLTTTGRHVLALITRGGQRDDDV